MPPDERRRADTISWFEKARKDIRCAEIDLAAEPPSTEDALYHCQQAAEKALKGFLVWHDEPFPRTHDLGKLGRQAVELDPTLEEPIDGRQGGTGCAGHTKARPCLIRTSRRAL